MEGASLLSRPSPRRGNTLSAPSLLLGFVIGAAALMLTRDAAPTAKVPVALAAAAAADNATDATDDAVVYDGCAGREEFCGDNQEGTRCGTCGEGCAGCDHQDCGFYGNAGCRLRVTLTDSDVTTSDLAMQLQHAIEHNNGPDGRYGSSKMAEGGVVMADLRPFNKSVDYILHATHNTTGGYVDDISITISPRSTAGVEAVSALAFSSSGIGGAYCDSGQNYKQILMLFEAIQAAWTLEHMDGSCSGGDVEWS